ncbi:MAG: hypothetical protein U1C71_00210, partial [archaeon]|nr:hypothetical protein [archaeon]
ESGFREKVASEEKRVKELEIKWERTQALNHILQKKRARQEMLREQVAAFESAYPQWAGKALPLLLESKEGLSKQATAALAAQELYRQREQVMVKAAQKVDFLQNRIREAHSFLSGKTFSEWRGEHTQIMGQRHDLEMRQQHAQQALQNAHSKIKVLQERMHFLEDEEKGLAALHAQCPTCKREMEEGHKKQLLADIVGRRAGLAQELEASEKEQEHLRKDMSGVDAVMKGLQSHVGRLDILLSKEADLIKTEEEMGRATIEWEAAQKQVEAMGPPISNEALEGWRTQVLELEKAVQNHTSVVELGKLGVEMDDLKKQAEAIAVEQDEVVEAHKALSIIQNEWGNARKEKDWIFRMVEELEGRVRDAEKVMGEQEKVRVRIARAGEITEQLGIFSHALQVTQEQLRTSVVEAINAALDEMWPSVYPYQDFRTARLKIEDSDYVLMLQERSGNWVAAESALSGGERSAAALALRMALAFVLTRQLSWVILDEPTHNLDSKSVNMLAMMLRERLPLLVDQVFVITHAPEIEKAATGSLYVLQREKDEDGITIPLLKPLGGGTPVH